jgi:isoamylase
MCTEDWNLLTTHADVHRFVTLLNAKRLLRDLEAERRHLSLNELLREAHITWHGIKLNQPDWQSSSHSIALSAESKHDKLKIHLMVNAYWEPLNFELPPGNGSDNHWRRWVDTSLDSPNDIVNWESAPAVNAFTYEAKPHSVVVLYADLGV